MTLPMLRLCLFGTVLIFLTSPSLFPPSRRPYNTQESNHSPAPYPIPHWSACYALFCVHMFFFSLFTFFLLPLIEPLEPGADGKIVVGGK